MTTLLILAALTLLLVPLLEAAWDPLWTRMLREPRDPRRRLRSLRWRLGLGLAGGAALSALLLATIHAAPRSHPMLPGPLVLCLGHSFEHGPGVLTHLFLVGSLVGLGVVTVALFYPLPSFPPGERRGDLEALVARLGVAATVEVLEAAEPGCWSERSPHPRILLLGGVERRLARDQLEAVLCHEAAHLAHGDHRTRTWVRAYRRLFCFSRGARVLFDDFVHEQERGADDQVLAWRPDLRGPLEASLVTLAAAGSGPAPAAPLGARGHAVWSVQQRVRHLRGLPEQASRRSLGHSTRGSLLAFAVLVSLAASSPGACTLHCLLDSLP